MPFNPKHFALTVPMPQCTTWVYTTSDDPETIETKDYFNAAAHNQGLRRLDLVKIIAMSDTGRPAVAEFCVLQAERKAVRMFRTTPWVRPSASPGAGIPSREDDLVEECKAIIQKMPKRHFTADGKPRRDILSGRLGYMPSAEIVDMAMTAVNDEAVRESDAAEIRRANDEDAEAERLREKARKREEAEAEERRKQAQAHDEALRKQAEQENAQVEDLEPEVPAPATTQQDESLKEDNIGF